MSVRALRARLETLAVAKVDAPKEERWREALHAVAAHAARTFQVTEREVAILLETDDGMHLKFVYPPPLGEGPNLFPLASASVAGEVVKAARGVVENAFAQTQHLGFYERVRLEGPKAGPIQKMVAAPIREAGPAFGVIEVSRKGADPAAAGPDFTAQDLVALEEIAATAGPYLLPLRPRLL
ncbi:MAG TPA: GAF domain-containing protein [Candidatus Methylomirabilis sp.]